MKKIEVQVPESLNDCVALQLRQARAGRDLTQTEAAKAAGPSQPVVSRLEKGKMPINVVHLCKLCRAYGTKPGQIVARAQADAAERGLED